MLRRHWHALLFALNLIALGALGSWWFTFFQRSVRFEHQAALQKIRSATRFNALKLGHSRAPLGPGVLADNPRLEIVLQRDLASGQLHASLRPMHPDLVLRPRPQVLQKIEQRMHRRHFMVVGEGSLLLLLFTLSVGMLYYMVRLERRQGERLMDFISTVTHEMKTPLAGIKSMLQTSAAGRISVEQLPELTTMALHETARLERLIENVLISGRMRSQTLQVRVEAQVLCPILRAFVALRRRDLPAGESRLQLAHSEAKDPDWAALLDVDALRIVLDNLVDNALKFSPDNSPVRMYVKREGGFLHISVEDEGRGFSAQDAKNLFKPFVRGRDVNGVLARGTGLGLSIVQRLVRAMGGKVTASSPGPGQGSRFVVSLKEANG